jgi:Flp pilus assembly protein TadD
MTRIRLLVLTLLTGFGTAQTARVLQEPALKQPGLEALLDSAKASMRAGNLEGASTAVEQLLSRDETNEAARQMLVEILIRKARWVDAQAQAALLAQQHPDETQPVYLEAVIALRRGDAERAANFAWNCIGRGDLRPEVHKTLALAEYVLGHADKFETHMRAALQQNALDGEAHYFLGRYLYESGNYGAALTSFQSVLGIDPKHYKAHYYAALAYDASGDKERSEQEFLASIEIIDARRIRYAWPFAGLGRQLLDSGESDRALAVLSRGIVNDPHCPKVHYEYARALFKKGPRSEVEQSLVEATRLDPAYSDAYYLLARYYQKTGQTELADQVLNKFRQLKKDTPQSLDLQR